MEEFRKNLKGCVDLYARQVAQLSSQIKLLEAENIDLKDLVRRVERKLERQISDFNKLESENINDTNKSYSFEELVKKELLQLGNFYKSTEKTFQEYIVIFKERLDEAFQKVDECYRRSTEDNERLKDEILSLPSEAQKVKEELLVKAAESAIDNAGILKEMQVIKKKAAIQESLNEYFHIQLNRLKEKVSS